MDKESGFKRTTIGWIIAVLTLFSAANSTFFFLAVMKTGVAGWLMMNSCAPAILIFFIGFLFKSPVVMSAGMGWMLRYGTAGLFAFGWHGPNIVAQVGHLLMTSASAYVAVEIIREKRWRAFVLGLLVGVGTLLPFTAVQNAWFARHPGLLESLFSGNIGPSGQ